MSIGIYASLRIYFLGFGLSAFAQFRTRCRPQRSRRPDHPRAACLVLSADRCSMSNAWACVCRCAVPCVVCLASGTACVVQSVRVRWGWGLHRRGIWDEPGGGVVDSLRRKNSKKAFSPYPPPLFCIKHPTTIVNFKNFPQKQKDPYKGSAFCAILALQALKGRNLQCLKVK